MKVSIVSREFVAAARNVNNILSMYDDDLCLNMHGLVRGKNVAWRQLELWLDILPKSTDENGKPTTIVTFPTSLPTRQLAPSLGLVLDFPNHNNKELAQDVENIKKHILESIETVHLDLTDKSSVASQLVSLSGSVEDISKARKDLAEFTKSSFPIDRILEY